MKIKKIFITGGTGQLGANLIVQLLKQKYKIKVLYRKNSFHPFLKNKKFEVVYADLLDKQSLIKALSGCDTVIHCGAFISYKKSDFNKLFTINVTGTKNLLYASIKNKVKNFIFISSTAAIGYSKNPYYPLNENHPFLNKYNKIGYMDTKHQAENEVLKYTKKMKVTIFNPSTMIGPGDNHYNTGSIFMNIKNRKIKIATPGGNSFVAVDDVINAILLALEKNIKSGQRYILSSTNLSFLEYFNLIGSFYHIPFIKKTIPKFFYIILFPAAVIIEFVFSLFHFSPPITSQLIKISFAYRYFDSSKARSQLQWHPKKNIKTAIKEAIEYYKRYSL